MRLFEIQYHSKLNPDLWDGATLKSEVKEQLLVIAKEFVETLEIPNLDVEDIILTGSNANFNWTPESDIDLHLVVDMSEMKNRCPEFTEDFFQDKKTLWNEHHDITIYEQPVEIYVQDAKEEHISSGVYSLMEDKWLKKPEYSPPSIDDAAVKAKAQEIAYKIKKLISSRADLEDVQKLREKVRKFRKAGLDANGEFSTENLAFKVLRKSGLLQKLSDYAHYARSEELSLD